ncbi:2'-5' RNA ligase family protein [endosymbiont of unidentified scaly snail isolate Monju]|uniref:2'-5' RNA ligase family protein n=1 Tax=endosymbiont of unidentified scaly snail isolate Monju TaxID=1248727 RepID=UPI0003892A24|nr:2'-5' RNA ligase family protein [endosymbiont of unidentified scaly snail isolate Monju]BAN69346.1 2'-5' RNA ligase [endosymbiont of unidentified scaly snail isolate Monju]
MSRRLFFALWPDEALRRRLADWQQTHLPPGVQPTHPADLHLTLHFLGQVEEGRLGALRELGDRLAGEAFALCLDHLGHWPGPRWASRSTRGPGSRT